MTSDKNALDKMSQGSRPDPDPPSEDAPPPPPPRVERKFNWTNETQFNLASWIVGKLRATIELWSVPDVGSMSVTLREATEDDCSAVDAIIASKRHTFILDGHLMRARDLGYAAMAITLIDGQPWADEKLDVKGRMALLLKDRGQTQADLLLHAYREFEAELGWMMQSVNPKVFSPIPSGNSAAR